MKGSMDILAASMLVVWIFMGVGLIFWAIGNASTLGLILGACICALTVTLYKVFKV